MSYKLIIAEKPSVAQSYAKVLGVQNRNDGFMEGNGYIVSWCIGHLVEMYMPDEYSDSWAGNWKLDVLPIIPDTWKYKISKNTSKQFKVLKKLMERDDVDEVIEACDAGREGELISRLVYYQVGCKKPLKRLWISSMEDQAILDGFNNLKDAKEYDALYQSALCRSKADWLIGMNGTRLFSCKYGNRLNVGRVVSPTLAMIVEREKEIEIFTKKPFYRVRLDLDGVMAFSEKMDKKDDAEKIMNKCNNATAVIAGVLRTEKSKAAPKLYDLTSLQRDASKYFGFTPKKTLEIAQELYEKKMITYPRTDSRYLTDDMEMKIRDVIRQIQDIFEFAGISEGKAVEVIKVLDSKKVSDHHAIITTGSISKDNIKKLNSDEQKILSLIANQVLLATMPVQISEQIEAQVACENEVFSVKCFLENDPGYKIQEKEFHSYFKINKPKNEIEDDECMGALNLEKNMEFIEVKASVVESFTKPPQYFTDSSLLAAMERAGAKEMDDEVERKGLGTPATRADIIEKLVNNGFIKRVNKQMLPTENGKKLISILPDKLKSPLLTAEWENKLVMVSKKEMEAEKFMEEIEKYVEEVVENEKNNLNESGESFADVIGACPNCKGQVIRGKYGAYCKDKCGMSLSRAYGVQLSDEDVKKLLECKKIKVCGIKSKSGKSFNAYLTPRGIKEYSYEKDGKMVNGKQFDFEMTFPE